MYCSHLLCVRVLVFELYAGEFLVLLDVKYLPFPGMVAYQLRTTFSAFECLLETGDYWFMMSFVPKLDEHITMTSFWSTIAPKPFVLKHMKCAEDPSSSLLFELGISTP